MEMITVIGTRGHVWLGFAELGDRDADGTLTEM